MEPNDASRRQQATIDAPALDLPIVEHGNRGTRVGRRRALSGEDAEGELPGYLAVRLEAQHMTPHDPCPDRRFGEPIDGHARDGGDPADHPGRREIAPGPVAQERPREDNLTLRQSRDLLEELLETEVDEWLTPMEPVEGALFFGGRHIESFSWRRSDDHDGPSRSGVKAKREVESLRPLWCIHVPVTAA